MVAGEETVHRGSTIGKWCRKEKEEGQLWQDCEKCGVAGAGNADREEQKSIN
jgi:hypothetical protein